MEHSTIDVAHIWTLMQVDSQTNIKNLIITEEDLKKLTKTGSTECCVTTEALCHV